LRQFDSRSPSIFLPDHRPHEPIDPWATASSFEDTEMRRRTQIARSAKATRIRSGLSRGYVDAASSRAIRALTLRYNLEQEPLSTGRVVPKVDLRVRAACAARPFYIRRELAGWLVIALLIALLGLWNLIYLLSV
jgi:hypothetical protein